MLIDDIRKKYPTILNPDVRHDFQITWVVLNGNPNGDPDTNGIRLTPDGRAFATDVSLMRSIRDYWEDVLGRPIYVSRKAGDEGVSLREHAAKHGAMTREQGIKTFLDVRLRGAVYLAGDKDSDEGDSKAQILGPIQFGPAISTEPVYEQEMTVTRLIKTSPKEKSDQTMGRRTFIEKAVMVQEGCYSGHLGKRHNVTEDDLADFYDGLINCWNMRRSTMRGLQRITHLKVLTYPDAFGHGEPKLTVIEFNYPTFD